MTTAADELRAASAFVRSVAQANQAISENRPLSPEMQGRTRADVARADMHPAVGRALADWLDSAAVDAEQIGADPHALAVARALNGDQP